jgi:CSLREA domain-containing protein
MGRRYLALGLLVACVVLLLLASSAQAETIEVTTTADLSDSSCPGPECSLREAIAVASSGDTIKLAGSRASPKVYELSLGSQIVVAKSLTIEGNGPEASVVDGSANDSNRILKVSAGTLKIVGMSFTDGTDGNDEGFVGCSPCETLRANGGGALFNAGATVILDEVVFEDDGETSGQPVGGAIGNAGTLELTNVSFTRDGAAIGGALFSRGGTITANGVTFEDDGRFDFDGGAVFLYEGGDATFTNTTIVGSGISSTLGGGIDNDGSTLTLINDTLSGNVRGSLETDVGGSTSVQNTILGSGFSDNVDFDCVAAGKGTNTDTTTAKAITNDLGNNIDQDGVCGLDASGDESGVNPDLAPIADNGGPTPTEALLHGSPAIDAGNDAACPVTDQRGIARPQGAHCDIGAFEAVLLGQPSASTGAATNIASSEATLQATIDLDGEAGGFHFLWGTSPAKLTKETGEAAAGVVSNDTPESELLDELEPETTYYFKAVADNASGSVPASNVLSFTTPSGPPGPPIVTEVGVVSVTETTATVEFTINPDGADTTYEVEYGPTERYGHTTKPVDIGATGGPKRFTETLTGLNAHSTYHFRVLAINSEEEVGVPSEDRAFTTERKPTGGGPGGAPTSSSTTSGCFANGKVPVVVSGPAGTKVVDYILGGAPVQSIPTNEAGEVTIPVPAGQHTLEYWGVDDGVEESPHHLLTATVATSPTLTIASDQGHSTYEVGEPASVTITATGVALTSDPSASHVSISTTTPGTFTVTRSAASVCGTTEHSFSYTVLAPPVLGKSVNVDPIKGKVLIALPPGASASAASLPDPLQAGLPSAAGLPGALAIGWEGPLKMAIESLSKGLTFIPLTEVRQVPVGSILEATAGVTRITTATAAKTKLQSGDFGAGIFKLLQARKQKGLTELDIMNAHAARQVCASLGKRAAVVAKLSGKVLGRLNANAHGKFTTKGQYSAATVRGTVWSVTNQCDGTLTKVQRGVVAVRDFVRRKTITLFTGQSYLARP